MTQFIPQKVEINTGQSITWINPTTVGEPHTVTFVFDNKTMAGVVSPLAVLNSTQFTPIPHGSNNQPVMMPGKSIVMAPNAIEKLLNVGISDPRKNAKPYHNSISSSCKTDPR